jgi:hypothetical protein
MARIGDRLSMITLVVACGGTFLALALTSAAKKASLLGPPAPPPWAAGGGSQKQFEERMKALDTK